jgi:hypothetical protein
VTRGRSVAAVAVGVLLISTACGSDVAGDPPTLAELPDRIEAAQEAGDLMVVLGCTPEHWRDDVWDFEGAADRATAEEAAAVVLADDHWETSRLPAGERQALFDQMFRLGPGLLLPVLVDGEVKVLLGYDAQGPDVWSIGGAAVCVPMP